MESRSDVFVNQIGPANDVKREGLIGRIPSDILKRVLQTTMGIEVGIMNDMTRKGRTERVSIAVPGFLRVIQPELQLCRMLTVDVMKDMKKYWPKMDNKKAAHLLERFLPLLEQCALMQAEIERKILDLDQARYQAAFHHVIDGGRELDRKECAAITANHYGWGIIQQAVSSLNNEMAKAIRDKNNDPNGEKPKTAREIKKVNQFLGNFVMDFISEAARSGNICEHLLRNAEKSPSEKAGIIMFDTLNETSDDRVGKWHLKKMTELPIQKKSNPEASKPIQEKLDRAAAIQQQFVRLKDVEKPRAGLIPIPSRNSEAELDEKRALQALDLEAASDALNNFGNSNISSASDEFPELDGGDLQAALDGLQLDEQQREKAQLDEFSDEQVEAAREAIEFLRDLDLGDEGVDESEITEEDALNTADQAAALEKLRGMDFTKTGSTNDATGKSEVETEHSANYRFSLPKELPPEPAQPSSSSPQPSSSSHSTAKIMKSTGGSAKIAPGLRRQDSDVLSESSDNSEVLSSNMLPEKRVPKPGGQENLDDGTNDRKGFGRNSK